MLIGKVQLFYITKASTKIQLVQRFSCYKDSKNAFYVSDAYLKKAYFFSQKQPRGGSKTLATVKMEFFVALVNTVNQCHKKLHLRCCRGSRYVSTIKQKNMIFKVLQCFPLFQ